jgi:hypothetical protein
MAITRIGNPAIADVRGVNFRNIIINGGMDIAQRGTSHTTASGYTLDRWHLNDGTSGEFTVTQSTTVPTGQGFSSSYKLDCTTADASPSSSEYLIFNQRIEGQNLQYIKKGTSSAESLTLSFYVRSNKTGDYVAELRDADNTRNNTIKYTISSADTWEKKTLTFAGDTSGALDNDNARSFDVNFWLLAGSNYTSGSFSSNTWSSITDANRAVGGTNIADSTSNEWYITGIQLETGSQASDFEFLPFDYQLRSCQRYYYQTYDYGTAFGTATYTGVPQRFTDNTSNYTSLQMFHPVPMRSAPSIVVYNPNTGGTGSGTTDSNVNKDIAAIQISQKYAHLHASDVSVSKSASIRCHITANSEL